MKELVEKLNLEEKILLLSGFNNWYTNKIERLEIPSIKMSDGPNGVRGDGTSGKTSACFPCPILMGSTWNEELLEKIGVALGEEAKDKDVDVLLGPTINLHRHPLGGRHFENYSEDPMLVGKLATAYVKGVQSQKVSACLKHFIANDTEFERHSVSSNVDERTLREVYLLPFEMGVKDGDAKSVMSAYNRLNNIFCSSHKEILIDILKEEWEFDGYVVSDWGAALETVENANGGLDLEMPGPGNTWGEKLLQAINDGLVDEKIIDDKVNRILSVGKFSGRFDSPQNKPEKSNVRDAHNKLLRDVACEGMVLLKNENLLPLDQNQISKIAIIGPNAKDSQIIGGGSASLKPHYQVHPFDALNERYKDDFEITYAKGGNTNKYLSKLDERLFSDANTSADVSYESNGGKLTWKVKVLADGANAEIDVDLKRAYFLDFAPYLLGALLTAAGVAKKNAEDFEVAVIPHTMKLTTFGSLKAGSTVNLEIDMMAKYLENLIFISLLNIQNPKNLFQLFQIRFAPHLQYKYLQHHVPIQKIA